jgi:acetyl esterase/lipase
VELTREREIVEQMMISFGRADDVATSDTTLGGVRATLVETSAALADRVILYLHGGAYALRSANGGAGLAAEVGRRTRARVYSLGYRLAPEYPYPTAIVDCIAAYRGLLDGGFDAGQIALAGESAGAGARGGNPPSSEDRGPVPAVTRV